MARLNCTQAAGNLCAARCRKNTPRCRKNTLVSAVTLANFLTLNVDRARRGAISGGCHGFLRVWVR